MPKIQKPTKPRKGPKIPRAKKLTKPRKMPKRDKKGMFIKG